MNKKKIIITTMIVLILIVILGTSYALWQLTFRQVGTNQINTGCFKLEFNDENPINLGDALPISDENGKKLVPYTFTLNNTCNSYANYQVNIEILDNTTITNFDYIKVQYENDEPELLSIYQTVDKTLSNAIISHKLATGYLDKNENVTLHLRLWLDENTPTTEEMMNKVFASKVTVTLFYGGTTYKERILNGTDPVLNDELIPVTIDNDGTVHKANTNEKWYNYDEKEWANAIILKDETKVFKNDEVIPENDIESYFVWIPRYRYKIFNDEKYNGLNEMDSSKVQTIEVEFENKDTPPSTGTKKNEWLTHPAFTSFNSNGMWVGKFETSKSNTNADNSRNGEGVQIKPNMASWANIQVANAFYTTYDYKRNLDSHMMKNSEWGAVAYLQHSKYGSNTKVIFNNNSNHITGYASVSTPTCGHTGDNRACNKYGTASDVTRAYNTTIGYRASTTGNISGIYDMAGGAWEYVMGMMTDQTNTSLTGFNSSNNSGFTGIYGEGGSTFSGYDWPEEKYFDRYAYGTSNVDFSRGHFGDATTEMGPFRNVSYVIDGPRTISSWHEEGSLSVTTELPWYMRGGTHIHGSEAGIFNFGTHTGMNHIYVGFRVVLTP